MSAVVSIGMQARTGDSILQDGVERWRVAEIHPLIRGNFLMEAIHGRPHEHVARSLWTQVPSIKLATEKLASYLTLLWPSLTGRPLLVTAIEKAVTKVDEALQRGESFHGRIVGIYLFWLASCVFDIARIRIYGYASNGERSAWQYFSVPLEHWIRANVFEYVEAIRIESDPTDAMVSGLRTHLIAHITEPVDAGFLEIYAPRG